MANEPVIEMVDKGLHNRTDRSMLGPGRLARANNCYYKPESPALHKHRGRAQYSGTVANPPLGMKYLEFDDVSRLVKVRSNGTNGILSTSLISGETGAYTDFGDIIGIPTGLEAIYFKDRHLMFTGANVPSGDLFGNNLAYLGNGTVRRMGLAPVVSPPTLALVTGAWPNDTDFPLGWYFFITTETTDEQGETAPFFLESSWEGDTMAAIDVNDAAKSVQVTFPTLVNAGQYADTAQGIIAAKRVYMAGPIAATGAGRPENPALSEFRLAGWAVVGAATTVVGATDLANLSVPTVSAGTFSNTARALTDNNQGATSSTNGQTLSLQTYGLAAAGTVYGIRVEAKGRYNGVGVPPTLYSSVSAQLLDAAGAPTGTAKTIQITTRSFATYERGGPTDMWGTTLTAANVNNANFGIRLTSVIPAPGSSPQVEIDVVRIQVYASGGATAFTIGQDFPYISIPVDGGTTVIYPSHSEPPIGTTADTFEGSIIQNDTNAPGEVVWSLPDNPEYFPSPYRMRIDPNHRDEVNRIQRLGEVVLVGMQKCLWKIVRLPLASDSFFNPSRLKVELCPDKGVVNREAMATFSSPGGPMLAAFVGLNGLFYTDGYSVDTLVGGIDWEGMVNVDKLSTCWLVNYPREHLLVFGYVPANDSSSTYPTKRLILHYHPSQTLDGRKLKVTGPIDLPATCAAPGFLNDKHILFSGHTNGGTYVEDRGWQDAAASNANLIMSVVTRDMYPGGIGTEGTVERVWWRHGQFANPEIIWTVTPWIKKTAGNYTTPASGQRWTGKARTANAGANLSNDLSTLSNTGALERTDEHFICESYCLEGATSDTNQGFSLAFYAMLVAGKGYSDNPG